MSERDFYKKRIIEANRKLELIDQDPEEAKLSNFAHHLVYFSLTVMFIFFAYTLLRR